MGVHKIGMDLGGTKLEAIILDDKGREIFRKSTGKVHRCSLKKPGKKPGRDIGIC
ncbi:hypothetical protein ACFL35_12195 [Candidatus Riflebacteria bacterium]